MDKLQLTGQNLGRVFNCRSGCMGALHLCCYEAKRPNLKLKTQPKQLLGSLPLAFVLLGQKNWRQNQLWPFYLKLLPTKNKLVQKQG
jgi:hypothetical protein